MGNGSLNRHKAERAMEVLIQNIARIRYVSDWARDASVSPEWLRKKMNLTYGKAPSRIIREKRFEVIIELILQEGVEVTSIEIAIESGIGQTSDSLYKFLKRYYGITFTELKELVLQQYQNRRSNRLTGHQKYTVYTEYGDIYTEIDDNMHLSNDYSSFLLKASRQNIQ